MLLKEGVGKIDPHAGDSTVRGDTIEASHPAGKVGWDLRRVHRKADLDSSFPSVAKEAAKHHLEPPMGLLRGPHPLQFGWSHGVPPHKMLAPDLQVVSRVFSKKENHGRDSE